MRIKTKEKIKIKPRGIRGVVYAIFKILKGECDCLVVEVIR